jgi:hypothetical protein
MPNMPIEFNNPPFSAAVQVTLFFIGVYVVPTLTAHTPIPVSREDSFGRTLTMILSPVSASIDAFNSIVIFIVKIGLGSWVKASQKSHYSYHDMISAGAFAIRIPIRFDKAIQQSSFEWKRLNGNIPRTEEDDPRIGDPDRDPFGDSTTMYSIPPTSRIDLEITSYKDFPLSKKLKIAFAILQLAYSVAQAYVHYEPIIHGHGISSSFIIAIAYLYSSFINLIANLVQGSYTHVIVIPSTFPGMVSSASSSEIQTQLEGKSVIDLSS